MCLCTLISTCQLSSEASWKKLQKQPQKRRDSNDDSGITIRFTTAAQENNEQDGRPDLHTEFQSPDIRKKTIAPMPVGGDGNLCSM